MVDDDPDILDEVADILVSLGHEFDRADSVESARQYLETSEYTYYLLDLEIPVRVGKTLPRIQNGENLLEEIVRRCGPNRDPVVIVMTAHGTDGPELAVQMMKKGASDYVTKPFKTVGRTLDKSIQEALANLESAASPGTATVIPAEGQPPADQFLRRFDCGELVFFQDRIELCGMELCNGSSRHRRQRRALELLKTRRGKQFEAYSGEELARQLDLSGGQNSAAGLIRTLRERIRDILRNELGFECSDDDVICSGGPGYRLSEKLTVQVVGQQGVGMIRDIEPSGDVPDVPNPDVRNVRNQNVRDTDSATRQKWILERLAAGDRMQASVAAEHFRCSVKTVLRDLRALKESGKIKFVGAPRTGYYQLRDSAGSTSS